MPQIITKDTQKGNPKSSTLHFAYNQVLINFKRHWSVRGTARIPTNLVNNKKKLTAVIKYCATTVNN